MWCCFCVLLENRQRWGFSVLLWVPGSSQSSCLSRLQPGPWWAAESGRAGGYSPKMIFLCKVHAVLGVTSLNVDTNAFSQSEAVFLGMAEAPGWVTLKSLTGWAGVSCVCLWLCILNKPPSIRKLLQFTLCWAELTAKAGGVGSNHYWPVHWSLAFTSLIWERSEMCWSPEKFDFWNHIF